MKPSLTEFDCIEIINCIENERERIQDPTRRNNNLCDQFYQNRYVYLSKIMSKINDFRNLSIKQEMKKRSSVQWCRQCQNFEPGRCNLDKVWKIAICARTNWFFKRKKENLK